MRACIIFLGLSLLSGVTHSAEGKSKLGSLELFRWNPGFRADPHVVMKAEYSRSEFNALLAGERRPTEVYAGCYLAHFQPSAEDWGVASAVAKATPEVHRICFPYADRNLR